MRIRYGTISTFGVCIAFVVGSWGLSCTSTEELPVTPQRERVDGVELTWLSTTTWLLRYDTTVVLLDAFFSRPLLAQEGSKRSGITRMETMLEAAGAPEVDAIIVGHSHYDHVVDVGAAALATGAQVYGSRTTCFVAQAQDLPESRCTVIGQGDAIVLGDVVIDVIRTIHWWPETNGIGVFDELTQVPSPVVASTAPNGGVLSMLFHFEQAEQPVTVFYQNTLGPMDGDDGSNEPYQQNLEQAFADVTQTTVWLGCPDCTDDRPPLDEYLSIIKPKTIIPHHWDGPMPMVEDGIDYPFEASAFYTDAVAEAGAELMVPSQYFERYLIRDGVLTKDSMSPIQQAFGLVADPF